MTAEREIAEASARKAALDAEKIAACVYEPDEDPAAHRARVAAMQDAERRRMEETFWFREIVEAISGRQSKAGQAARDRYRMQHPERRT
jgi:hypothetical protein